MTWDDMHQFMKSLNPTVVQLAGSTVIPSRSATMNSWPWISFGTWLAAGLFSTSAADVAYYGFVKSSQYVQAAELSMPALAPTNAFAFTGFAVSSNLNSITSASFTNSVSTAVHALEPDTNGLSWRFEAFFDSQSALDTAHPARVSLRPVTYTMNLGTTNDGPRQGDVSFYLLLFPLSFPSAPRLLNLADAQGVDATREFTLQWAPLGGTALSIVQLTVLDAASNLVYSSAFPFQPGALDGTSTAATIPAWSLPSGSELRGHLTIANPGMPNTNSYPGAVGIAALATDTQFKITTRPAPQAPRLSLQLQSDGSRKIGLTGETNRVYHLESTENGSTWTNLFTTNCVSGGFDYLDLAPPQRWRFYRGRVGQ